MSPVYSHLVYLLLLMWVPAWLLVVPSWFLLWSEDLHLHCAQAPPTPGLYGSLLMVGWLGWAWSVHTICTLQVTNHPYALCVSAKLTNPSFTLVQTFTPSGRKTGFSQSVRGCILLSNLILTRVRINLCTMYKSFFNKKCKSSRSEKCTMYSDVATFARP